MKSVKWSSYRRGELCHGASSYARRQFQPVGHLFPEPEGSGGRDYVESNNVGDPGLLGNIVNGKIAHSVAIKDEKVAKLVKDGIDYVRH